MNKFFKSLNFVSKKKYKEIVNKTDLAFIETVKLRNSLKDNPNSTSLKVSLDLAYYVYEGYRRECNQMAVKNGYEQAFMFT